MENHRKPIPESYRELDALIIVRSSYKVDPAMSSISFCPLNNLGGVLTFPFIDKIEAQPAYESCLQFFSCYVLGPGARSLVVLSPVLML